MLTDRQKLTIKHFRDIGITDPLSIIERCVINMNKGRKSFEHRLAVKNGTAKKMGTRKHSIKYYQQIINHIAQGGSLNQEIDRSS